MTGPSPLVRTAFRVMSPLVNPRGRADDAALRAAVAGKIVLVTGASYGLGEATARRLGRAGATVLLVARTADRLASLAEAIRAAGGTAHVHPADLTDGAAVDALVDAVLARHGHVDIVVSNAGKSIRRSLARSYRRPQDVERTIAINYVGPVRLLLGLLPAMRARGQGHIVNISTVGARLPPGPRWGAYQASKTAFDVWLRDELLSGQVFTLFVITVAAAEVGLGLAIVLLVFRNDETSLLDELDELAEEPVLGRWASGPQGPS